MTDEEWECKLADLQDSQGARVAMLEKVAASIEDRCLKIEATGDDVHLE